MSLVQWEQQLSATNLPQTATVCLNGAINLVTSFQIHRLQTRSRELSMKTWTEMRMKRSTITLVSVAIVALMVSVTVQVRGLDLIWKHRQDQTENATAIKHERKLNEPNSTTIPRVENPPCSDILLCDTPRERCQHALECDGEYLMKALLPLAFCMNDSASSPLEAHPTIRMVFPVFFPMLMILVTVMLFRLLASTAEDYFSPALEMISSEFRVPPPLAGVVSLFVLKL